MSVTLINYPANSSEFWKRRPGITRNNTLFFRIIRYGTTFPGIPSLILWETNAPNHGAD